MNTVRTALLLTVLLTAPLFGAAVNFTEWTEIDESAVLTVTSGYVLATSVLRSTGCVVQEDYTAGYFEDFHARFEFTPGALDSANSWLMALMLSNAAGDWQDNYYANTFGLRYQRDAGGTLYLSLVHQAPTYASASVSGLSVSTKYYVDVIRDFDGGAYSDGLYTLYVCTTNYYGLSGASLVGTTTLTVPDGQQAAYRYAGVMASRANSTFNAASAKIEALEFVTEEPPAEPDIYYVDAGESVTKYNSGMSPGDVIEFRAATPGGVATFRGCLWFANSGTEGHPIIYRARAGDTIIIDGFSDSTQYKRSLDIEGQSWITVQGFTLTNTRTSDDDSYWVWAHTHSTGAEGIVLEDLTMDGGGMLAQRIDGLTIRNCTIANAPVGGIVLAGSDTDALCNSLIEGCTIYGYGTDAITLHEDGYYNSLGGGHVIKDCTVYGGKAQSENAYDLTSGWDILLIDSTATGCIEPAVLIGGYHGDNRAQKIRVEGCTFFNNGAYSEAIFAGGTESDLIQVYHNVFYGTGEHHVRTSSESEPGVRYVRVAHNTFDATGLSETPTYAVQFQNNVDDVSVQNNIFLLDGDTAIYWQPNPSDSDMLANYNIYHDLSSATSSALWYYTADRALAAIQGTYTREINGQEIDPNFYDLDSHVYTLIGASAVLNDGGWLTTCVGTSSGTSLTVADPNWFHGDWGTVAAGDTIQLEGQTTTAVVEDVNYVTHVLTLDTSLSWTDGDGVAFAYSGSAPDPGAFESAALTPSYTDFTTWTEVDPGSRLTITDANQISAADLPGYGTYYLGYDWGPDYWAGDFTVRWRSTLASGSSGTVLTMFSLQNAMVGYRDVTYGLDAQMVLWRVTGSTPYAVLDLYDDGVSLSDAVALSYGVEYFFTLVRDLSLSRLTVYVTRTAHYGQPDAVAVDTLTVAIPTDEQLAYRYTLTLQNKSTAGVVNLIAGSVTHLDLGTPSGGPEGDPGEEPGEPGEPGEEGVHGPYYVAINGSNSNNGVTPATAWATLLYALDNAVLSATQEYNVIYLMSGNHPAVNITTKTWASDSWDNDWTITCYSAASLAGLAVHVHDAYLTFDNVNVFRSTPHNQSSFVVELEACSDIHFFNSHVKGYWDTADSLNTSGYGVGIRSYAGSYCEQIEVNDVTIEDIWCGLHVSVWSGEGTIRSGIKSYDVEIINRNQTAVGVNWPMNRNDAYDVVEFHNIRATQQTRAVVTSSSSGWPHGNGFSGRGDHFTLDGFVCTAYGGSSAIQFYSSSGSHYDNVTVENCVWYGTPAMNARFYLMGENCVIRNNTIVSVGLWSTTRPAQRYVGAVALQASTAVTPDVTFSNNVIVGTLDLGDSTYIDGENNIVWSVYQNGAWKSTLFDANDVVVVKDGTTSPAFATGYTLTTFETQGQFFLGDPTFGTTAWLPRWDSTNQVFLDPVINHSDYTVFSLTANSPAVDTGDPGSASTYDVIGTERDVTPDIGAFEYSTGAPPPRPSNPIPAHGATNVSVTTALSWSGVAENWNLYIGPSPTALELQGNLIARSYEDYVFVGDTTYYWRVDANSVHGLTPGSVWSFTTATTLPAQVTGPNPIHGATNVATSRSLSWIAAARASSYDVYLNGVFYTATSATSVPVTLAEATTYTWRVDAVGVGGVTAGSTWTFTTYAPTDPGDPGTPGLPDLPSTGVRIVTPRAQAERSDRATARYGTQHERLNAVEIVNETGLPRSYAVGQPNQPGDGLSGWLERIVIYPTGTDTDWALTITDSWGGELFSATDLDMTEGVVSYSGERLPFIDGLIVTMDGTTADSAETIRLRLYLTELW